MNIKLIKKNNFIPYLPFDVNLPELIIFPSLGVLIVDDEYLDDVNVKRPYSLEVGIFKDIVVGNFGSSFILNKILIK